MAKLPGHPAHHLIALALLLAALPGRARAADEVDLVGTWHVLVHYTDDNSTHPEAVRWDDRVWVFERKGSRLHWTEYPIVVFTDESGRFEGLGTSRQHRVVGAWEPNESQRAQIEGGGLEINTRGSKAKSLRGSDAEGWHSSSRATAASASVITYQENWSIEGLPARPVFSRADVLGSAQTESLEGITRYATTEVGPGGEWLSGTFVRDGTRHGTFRMSRAGGVSEVEGSGKSQGQRLMEAWFGDYGAALLRGDGTAVEEEWARRIREGESLPPEVQQEIRDEIRSDIERDMRRGGLDPSEHRERVDRLTDSIYRQLVEEGRSAEEVGEMIRSGRLPL